MKSSSSSSARLVDDAFVKICTMVNDGSMKVRAEAMGLLGSLHLVSSVYLEQTLDKKLMSHLRVGISFFLHQTIFILNPSFPNKESRLNMLFGHFQK